MSTLRQFPMLGSLGLFSEISIFLALEKFLILVLSVNTIFGVRKVKMNLNFWKNIFLILIAFPYYLKGPIVFESTMEMFFFKVTKYQRARINSFRAADFQKGILGDFIKDKSNTSLYQCHFYFKKTIMPDGSANKVGLWRALGSLKNKNYIIYILTYW